MRRIAIINQKGGVGKTTTAVNLGAALARLGRRVVVIDMDPQANASMNLGAELGPNEPSTYTILTQGGRVADTLTGTSTPGLSVIPAHLDLSGAELELASAIGRETILRDALDEWEDEERERTGRAPADVILIDNPPSLGLLSVNGLAASTEVLIAVQTEFFALQGLSKLVEIVQLLRRRMNPELEITGVLACLYDSRLRLAREVLGELRAHFSSQVFRRPIAQNVKLAETPSFGRTIFEYAPDSKGAEDYLAVAREFLEREGVSSDPDGRAVEPAGATAVTRESGPREPRTEESGAGEPSADVGPDPPAAVGDVLDVEAPRPSAQEAPDARKGPDGEDTDGEDTDGEDADPEAAGPVDSAAEDLDEVDVPAAPRSDAPAATANAPAVSLDGPINGPHVAPEKRAENSLATADARAATALLEGAVVAPTTGAIEHEVRSEPAEEVEPAAEVEPEAQVEPDLQVDPGPQVEPESLAGPRAEKRVEAEPETQPGSGHEPGPDPERLRSAEAMPEPDPEIAAREVTPAPRLRTPRRTRTDDRGEERAETPSRGGARPSGPAR